MPSWGRLLYKLMATEIKSVKVSQTGMAVVSPSRLRGIVSVSATNQAGTVVFRNGGAGGNIIFEYDKPAISTMTDIEIPLNGMAFPDGIHVTLTNVTSINVVYTDIEHAE